MGISVRCDGYIWSRCSHHGIGSTANITTCAGVRGGRGGGKREGRVEGEGKFKSDGKDERMDYRR